LEKLLTASDVGKLLRISSRTVNKLAREGNLRYVQVTTKKRGFLPEHVEEYINSRDSGIDKPRSRRLPPPAKKGGGSQKLVESSRTDLDLLKKEIREW
jgi:excisionase family DNA binding protein